jgi:hypothetical protein
MDGQRSFLAPTDGDRRLLTQRAPRNMMPAQKMDVGQHWMLSKNKRIHVTKKQNKRK